jgi:hypothetical protein
MTSFVGIILMGGLGNRLFQISFIYSYSKKYNKQPFIAEEYFNPHDTKIANEYHKYVYPQIKKLNMPHFPMYMEPENKCISFCEINKLNNYIFRGYFQCEKYFFEYREDIINLFNLSPQKKYEINKNSFFVHIRRGDYLKSDFHQYDLTKYYEISINYIKSKYPDTTLYLVSDDILYCRQNKMFQEIHNNIVYVEDLDELETMDLMRNCLLGGIACNSSFSWWGGYLNKNEDKIVIFPSKWFNDRIAKTFENDVAFGGSYICNIENYQIFQKKKYKN